MRIIKFINAQYTSNNIDKFRNCALKYTLRHRICLHIIGFIRDNSDNKISKLITNSKNI